MRIDVITVFPEMFDAVRKHGVIGRACEHGLVEVSLWNPRDYATDAHRSVDDRPYGGGPGMVMLAAPLEAAITAARANCELDAKVVYMTPQGDRLTHRRVTELATRPGIVLLAGRYEGIDERVIERCVDEELSIGDYVLSGGELAAMVVIDAVVRQLEGVLGNQDSAGSDSFVDDLLDCSHYTRPEVYQGLGVPQVLLSGNHREIERWRLKQSLGRTWLRRPELLQGLSLDDEQRLLLQQFQREHCQPETQ